MNESLDIMSCSAVEEYENFLLSLKVEMDGLVEETSKVARFLDGHDVNRFTTKLGGFLETIAQNAIQSSQHIGRDIVEVFLNILDIKNEAVGSSTQDAYIQQLRSAARQMEEVQNFRDCELMAGGKAFNSEEQEEFLTLHMVALIDCWEDRILELKRKAEALQDNIEQDEMSETFMQITAALEQMVYHIAESANEAGYHLLNIQNSYEERKQRFTQSAQDGSSSVQNAMSRILGDALDDLTDIVF